MESVPESLSTYVLILSLLVSSILFTLVGSMSLATLFVTNLLPNLGKFLFEFPKNLFELPKIFLKNLSEKLLWKISLKNPFENSF